MTSVGNFKVACMQVVTDEIMSPFFLHARVHQIAFGKTATKAIIGSEAYCIWEINEKSIFSSPNDFTSY
jgi:hypothetical protein